MCTPLWRGTMAVYRFLVSALYFFILEIGMNVRAHLLVPPHVLGSTAFKMRLKDETGKSFPKLSNDNIGHRGGPYTRIS